MTTKDLVPTKQHKFRKRVPEAHRTNIDTRIMWLWHQRFGTVQTVWQESPDVLDHTAAMLILQAIMGKDLDSIAQIFQRIEGSAMVDADLHDKETTIRI